MGFLKCSLNLWTKRKDVKLFGRLTTFTDDTVLTVAVADAILTDRDYARAIKSYARRHPLRGYGAGFLAWMVKPGYEPYHSFGNGSAMRVSPVGIARILEAICEADSCDCSYGLRLQRSCHQALKAVDETIMRRPYLTHCALPCPRIMCWIIYRYRCGRRSEEPCAGNLHTRFGEGR